MLGNIDYRNPVDYSHPHLRDCELLLKALPTLRGDVFYDLSPHGRHGTLTNMNPASDWVIRQRGIVLDLDGSDDRVSIPDQDGLSFGDGTTDMPLSVMAWTRIEGYGGGSYPFYPIVSKYDSYDPFRGEYLLSVSSAGAVEFMVLDDGTANRCMQSSASSAIATNTWVHVAAVYDGSAADEGITLYLNGEVLASTGKGQDGSYVAMHNRASPVDVGAALYAGTDTYRGYANGQIDDARTYSRALTAEELRDIYLDTLGMRYSWIPRVGAGLPVMSYYQAPTAFVPQIMEYPIQRRQLVAVGYR